MKNVIIWKGASLLSIFANQTSSSQSKGQLTEAGYSTSLILDYDRRNIKANALRIKEWDYYLITDGKTGLALTIADNSYIGLASISLLDFETAGRLPKA